MIKIPRHVHEEFPRQFPGLYKVDAHETNPPAGQKLRAVMKAFVNSITSQMTTWTEVIELRGKAADLGFRWTQPEAYEKTLRRLSRAEDALEWQRLTARYEGKIRELPA